MASAIESIWASNLRLAASSADRSAGILRLDDLDLKLAGAVEELVQRRIEQADRYRHAVHGLENAQVVADLHVEQLRKLLVALVLVLGEDVVLDDHLPLAEEHVLGAAQADALRAELATEGCIIGSVGVCSDTHRSELIRPLRIWSKSPVTSGLTSETGPTTSTPMVPSIEIDVALVNLDVGAADASDLVLGIDLELLNAAHAWLAHSARDDSRVTRLAAVRREDALRSVHAVQVVGVCLPAHENRVLDRPLWLQRHLPR